MFERLKGVLLLDVATFEEIEHDESATGQAAIVVAVVAILSGIGIGFSSVFGGAPSESSSAIVNFIITVVWAFIAWFVWSGVTYFIGTKLFHGEATFGEMLRVTGYGLAPMAFIVLSAIPCIGLAIALIVMIWSLAAVFFAAKSGLDLDAGRTLVTVIVGWIVYAIGMSLILSLIVGISSFI